MYRPDMPEPFSVTDDLTSVLDCLEYQQRDKKTTKSLCFRCDRAYEDKGSPTPITVALFFHL